MTNINFYTKRLISNASNEKFPRYTAWENCYKSFQRENDFDYLALSLGFYLASWGMYRGSSGLLYKNHKVHIKAIEILKQEKYSNLYCSEINEVSSDNIRLISEVFDELSSYYSEIKYRKSYNSVEKSINPTDTLITKVLLGVMGCVPAYDRYLLLGLTKIGVNNKKFSEDSLLKIFEYINKNYNSIKLAQNNLNKKFNLYYPIMKIIDFYLWELGSESD